jgi:hypothetical protein
MWELGEELELSRRDTQKIVTYLQNEELLESAGLGGGISITHKAIKQIENPPTKFLNPNHL